MVERLAILNSTEEAERVRKKREEGNDEETTLVHAHELSEASPSVERAR